MLLVIISFYLFTTFIMRTSKINKELLRICASRCAEFLYDMHGVLKSTPTCSMHDIVRDVEALLRVFVMLLKGTYTKCTLPRPRVSKHFDNALIELGVSLQILRIACKAFSFVHVNVSGATPASAKAAVVHSAIDLKLVAENIDTIRTYLDRLLGIYGDEDAQWWFQYLAVFRTSAETILKAARASGDVTRWMAVMDEEAQRLGPTVSPMGMNKAEQEREHSSPTETQNIRNDNDIISLERYLLELKEHTEALRIFRETFEQVPPSKASQPATTSNDDWRDSEIAGRCEDSAASRALLIRNIEMREAELFLMYEQLAIAENKATTKRRWERMSTRISNQRWEPIGGMKMEIIKCRSWTEARGRK